MVYHESNVSIERRIKRMIKRIAEALENGQRVHIMMQGEDDFITEDYEDSVFRILDHDELGILLKTEEDAVTFMPWNAIKMIKLAEKS